MQTATISAGQIAPITPGHVAEVATAELAACLTLLRGLDEPHGAHHRWRRQPDPAPAELSVQEPGIETGVVRDQDPPGQELPQGRGGIRACCSVFTTRRYRSLRPVSGSVPA